MNTRCAAIAVLAVFVMLSSSAVVLFSSDSEADSVYDKYYYSQLTDDQKKIYDAYSALGTDLSGSAGAYYYEVTVTGLSEVSESDAERAWEATRLDNPYAFWTWTTSTCAPSLAVSGNKVTISIEDAFADMGSKVDAAKAAVDAITLKGKSQADRVDSINSVLEDADKYKYSATGACTVYGIVGDGTRELSAAGFAAVFQALCARTVNGVSVECMTVYGTYADGSSNTLYAWDLVYVGKQVYACDPATSNKEGEDAWLCAGRYSTYDGEAFAKMHLPFEFNTWMGVGYDFDSELMCNGGYDWPEEEESLVDKIVDNAPWIIVGVICVVLAITLVIMARKEGQA